MWAQTTQWIPSNSAYQLLLGPGEKEGKKQGGPIIPESLTGQINSTMWVIWPRWTPESRGVRVVQKPSEFLREVRVPALPQHPLIIKGLVSQMDFTVSALGHMPAWRLGAAPGSAAQWKPLVGSKVHFRMKGQQYSISVIWKGWQYSTRFIQVTENLALCSNRP